MSGGDYLAAAYLVFLAVLLAYLVIIALKLSRLQRELGVLAGRAKVVSDHRHGETPSRPLRGALAPRGPGPVG